jgi:hypothetical protein
VTDRYDYNQDHDRINNDMLVYKEINKNPEPLTSGAAIFSVVAVLFVLLLNWLMLTYPAFFSWLGSLK